MVTNEYSIFNNEYDLMGDDCDSSVWLPFNGSVCMSALCRYNVSTRFADLFVDEDDDNGDELPVWSCCRIGDDFGRWDFRWRQVHFIDELLSNNSVGIGRSNINISTYFIINDIIL